MILIDSHIVLVPSPFSEGTSLSALEAMASGCVVISERLYEQTVKDLKMTDSIIQVNSPIELKEKLKLLKSKPDILTEYLENSKVAIQNNTWHNRAFEMQKKFQEVCN